MPSPAMATTFPSFFNFCTISCFWSGSTSASTFSIPNLWATALAVFSLSPVSITIFKPAFFNSVNADNVVSFIGSATPTIPPALESTVTYMTVAPSSCNFMEFSSNLLKSTFNSFIHE